MLAKGRNSRSAPRSSPSGMPRLSNQTSSGRVNGTWCVFDSTRPYSQTRLEILMHDAVRVLQISNLVPKGNWRPTDREISLATRRDTRWTKV